MNEYVDNEARKAKLVGKTVTMAHGAGGHQTSELIDMIFKAHFDNPDLTADDQCDHGQKPERSILFQDYR